MSDNSQTNVTNDPGLDILSLVQTNTKSAKPVVEENTVSEQKPKAKTPLQIAMEKKQSGMIINNDEFKGDGPSKNPIINDEREKEFQDKLDEMDSLIEKAQYVKMDKSKITSDIEQAQAIQALADTDIEDLKAVANGNFTEEEKNIDLLDQDIDTDTVSDLNAQDRRDRVKSGYFNIRTKNTPLNIEPEFDENGEEIIDEDEVDPEKEKIVQVIIDKTGLGIDMNFTDEEKKKIELATTIRVTEVEDVQLKSLTMERSDKSFLDMIKDEEYSFDLVLTPMTFPCSRFKAQMAGLSFGELGDIAMSNDSDEYDVVKKRYQIIYEKMKNVSIGSFESFDDFLKNFAYIDAELAIYGSYISTSPEEDSLILKCNHPGCEKSFEQKFKPRSLVDLRGASKTFLKKMKETAEANGADAVALHKSSPIISSKTIELPDSKFLCEIGMLSCYDNLEKVINSSALENFQEAHPDDVNNVKELGAIIINIVRSISIPVKGQPGKYRTFDKLEDILEICYVLSPKEFKFLFNLISKYATDYTVRFGIPDVECPYCHTKTKFVEVPITDQVFRQYQAQLSTNLDLSVMPEI